MMICTVMGMCMLMLMTRAGAGRGVVPVTVRHNVHPMIGRAGYWYWILGESVSLVLGTGRAFALG